MAKGGSRADHGTPAADASHDRGVGRARVALPLRWREPILAQRMRGSDRRPLLDAASDRSDREGSDMGGCRLLWGLPLLAAALPSIAFADTDACALLTPAEIGSAVGVPVTAGSHVTPTYVKTCTWNPASSGSAIRSVTLFLQTPAAYDSGKKQIAAARLATGANGTSVKPASVGDDGYYFVSGDQVGLLVKKRDVSFKVTVYATLPVDKKEAIELALARAVVAKL
jgi:hypothetical protein